MLLRRVRWGADNFREGKRDHNGGYPRRPFGRRPGGLIEKRVGVQRRVGFYSEKSVKRKDAGMLAESVY